MNETTFLYILIAFGIGFGLAFLGKGRILAQKIKATEDEAAKIVEDAQRSAETLLKEANLEAKDRLFKMKSEFDAETKETKSELNKRERRLNQKEEVIDRKAEEQIQKENELNQHEKAVGQRALEIKQTEAKYNELIEEQKKQLEKISTLTADQAKELLLRAMENEARYEGAKLIKRIENVVYFCSFCFAFYNPKASIRHCPKMCKS